MCEAVSAGEWGGLTPQVRVQMHDRSSLIDVGLWGSCVEAAACPAPSPQLTRAD